MLDANSFQALLEDFPVIAAVKDDTGLSRALESGANVVFALYGSVVSVPDIAGRVKEAGKACFLHLDLVDGLSPRDASVEFIARNTKADGIISTKSGPVKKAAGCGLLAIQRFFLLDSMAMETIRRQYTAGTGCAVEILPGLMPKIIRQLSESIPVPVIAGGLIRDKEDATAALSAGALAVSSTNPELWDF